LEQSSGEKFNNMAKNQRFIGKTNPNVNNTNSIEKMYNKRINMTKNANKESPNEYENEEYENGEYENSELINQNNNSRYNLNNQIGVKDLEMNNGIEQNRIQECIND